LRKAFAASVVLAFLAGFASSAQAAAGMSKRYPVATSKREAEKNSFGDLTKSTLQLVVSLANQRVTLYSNAVRVAQAPVSTGTPARPTPTGIFSVIEKDRWHRSNLYDNAPMFYMQRLTWSGVAMHVGVLPGVPASHGCIRLPQDFAVRLWGVTKLGVRIVVARNDVIPHDFSHPALFEPKPRPEPKPADGHASADGPIDGLRPTVAVDAVLPIAFAEAAAHSEPVVDYSAIDMLAPTGVETTATTPADATAKPKAALAPPPTESMTAGNLQRIVPVSAVDEPAKPALDSDEPRKPASAKRVAEPVKRGGQVAVFVSRKEKKIFVRQGFVPLFDMPIEIADPDRPLGTHVFTAIEFQDNGARMRWNVMSMSGEPSHAAERNSNNRRKSGRNREPLPEPVVAASPEAPALALSRIQMPPEAVDRIGELLIPGSSLVISDEGLGRETGRFTEFVVLTR
jgi:hypothetical protein